MFLCAVFGGTETLYSNLDCRMTNIRQGLILTSPNVKSIDISAQNKHQELYRPGFLHLAKRPRFGYPMFTSAVHSSRHRTQSDVGRD
jgi:hypothetical protein